MNTVVFKLALVVAVTRPPAEVVAAGPAEDHVAAVGPCGRSLQRPSARYTVASNCSVDPFVIDWSDGATIIETKGRADELPGDEAYCPVKPSPRLPIVPCCGRIRLASSQEMNGNNVGHCACSWVMGDSCQGVGEVGGEKLSTNQLGSMSRGRAG